VTRPRAILLIGPDPPPLTGMEIATQALVSELKRAGVAFRRVDTGDPTDLPAHRGSWSAHNVRLALRHLRVAARGTWSREVSAVYVPIAQEFPTLWRDVGFIAIARLARKPVVIHLHGGYFDTFYKSSGSLARLFIDRTVGSAAMGIVLTERLRPALECLLPPERVAVVENGVRTSFEQPPDRTRGAGAVNILFLSSLLPGKGIGVFIEAIALAASAQPTIRATVAGPWRSDAVKRQIMERVEALGMRERVRFVGAVGEEGKAHALANADIFCFPSTYHLEGQPLVVIEAMAAGLPVVASTWRGIPDTAVDGETALLVDDPTPEAVAEKLVYLAVRPAERRRLGTAGRVRYEQRYTQEAFGERIVPLIRQFADQAGDRERTTSVEARA
jgi:glycosyltransferase involved in cell wall biosynthesis